jgi:hypothetical protein
LKHLLLTVPEAAYTPLNHPHGVSLSAATTAMAAAVAAAAIEADVAEESVSISM